MTVVLFPSAYAPAVGGVEELTRQLAARLMAQGDAVEVWTNRHPTTLAPDEVIDGVRVRRFALPMPRMSAAGLAGFPAAATVALGRLAQGVRRARPDVLHVQCFSSNGVYAAAVAELSRVPLVVSLQGETVMDDHDIYDHSLALRAGLRMGLRRAAVVTACSQFVLSDAQRRFGLAEGAGTVVPNGVDVGRGEIPIPLKLPFTRFVLGLGRAVRKKGFDLLLESFSRLAAGYPDVGLVIGGDGAARGELVARVGQLGLRDRVVLPGTLSRGEVAWAMAHASVFVLPSRVEPFGIVVLEALSAGRPVVVSNRGGAGEIVRDGLEGLHADPTDADGMATAIARLLDDEELRRRVAGAGAARATEFSWDQIADRYREVYRSAPRARSWRQGR